MIATFDRAVHFVLEQEGGLVDDPADPGGLTHFGIALAEHPHMTADQIRSLTVDEAIAIYHSEYWVPIEGDALPMGIDFAALDCAVNQGVRGCVQFMQGAARVTVDGIIGPATLGALRAVPPIELLARFTALRIERYSVQPEWKRFGNGWTHRAILASLEAVNHA